MHTTDPSNPRETRTRRAGKSFSEKKSSQVPEPPPRPKTISTVMLDSGETRRVEIEATNDPAWAKFSALVEAATGMSLDGKGVEHLTMQAVVEMRTECEARGEELRAYWLGHGIRVPKETKSPFQPPVMYLLTRMTEHSGQKHTTKASKMAGAMDEYWECERLGIDGETVGQIIDGVPFGRIDAETGAVVEPVRIEPVPPDRFAEWLDEKYVGLLRGDLDARRASIWMRKCRRMRDGGRA